jgi:hypothetical protein
LQSVLKAHRFIFENKQETIRVMMHWLSQPPDVAARSYELALMSLSKNGEIPDPLDEVRDYTLLREAQN